MDILLIGGSGFLSGTIAREAVAAGHHVWAVTRGQRQLPDGVRPLVADRQDRETFAQVIREANLTWDLVVDVIPFKPEDAAQDLDVLATYAGHLVFISTDFVYDTTNHRLPRDESHPCTSTEGYGRHKRQAESVLIDAGFEELPWTILRPCHIYGPGSLLGCLPDCGRQADLLDRLRRGEALPLVGGGYFLQQPIFAADLARTVLSCAGVEDAMGGVYNVAGPDIIESREYYRIIAEILGCELTIQELPVGDFLAEKPQAAPFLCHRIYDLAALRRTGLAVPDTAIEDGLRQHVDALLSVTP